MHKFIKAARLGIVVASVSPVIIGTSLAFANSGRFDAMLFVLAIAGIIFIHIGANLFNDYYDHKSGNDSYNTNVTSYSGGSRSIQDGVVEPSWVFKVAIICTLLGVLTGATIIFIVKSIFIFCLGAIGIAGAYFYSAKPFRFAYRGLGEALIFLLFGVMPVYGAYFLQTRIIDHQPLLPALIISVLIFTLIVINEIPDREADRLANKRTLVVLLGLNKTIWLVRICLGLVYVLDVVSFAFYENTRIACGLLIVTVPIAVNLVRILNVNELQKPHNEIGSKLIVRIHALSTAALTAGFIIAGFLNQTH